MQRRRHNALQLYCDLIMLRKPRMECDFPSAQRTGFEILKKLKAVRLAKARLTRVKCPICGSIGDFAYADGKPVCDCPFCMDTVIVPEAHILQWKADREWLENALCWKLGLDRTKKRSVDDEGFLMYLGSHKQFSLFLLTKDIDYLLLNQQLYYAVTRFDDGNFLLITTKRCVPVTSKPAGVSVIYVENLCLLTERGLEIDEPFLSSTNLADIPHPICGGFSPDFRYYFFEDGTSVDFTKAQSSFFKRLWEANGEWRKKEDLVKSKKEGSVLAPSALFPERGKGERRETNERRKQVYDIVVEVDPPKGLYRFRMPKESS